MASCKLDQNLDVNIGSRSETIDIGTLLVPKKCYFEPYFNRF